MKKDVILAGVGGQGILTIAAVIGSAALSKGWYLKQAETHGMSQRGGDVQSHLRVSSDPIFSDLIPMGSADMIISVEPMESLRYLPYLSPEGWVITNTTPMINIPNYPELDTIVEEVKKSKNQIAINAEKIAKEIGNPRATNMVVLGAALPYLGFSEEEIISAIKELFGRKGEKIVQMNIEAIKAGEAYAKAQ